MWFCNFEIFWLFLLIVFCIFWILCKLSFLVFFFFLSCEFMFERCFCIIFIVLLQLLMVRIVLVIMLLYLVDLDLSDFIIFFVILMSMFRLGLRYCRLFGLNKCLFFLYVVRFCLSVVIIFKVRFFLFLVDWSFIVLLC